MEKRSLWFSLLVFGMLSFSCSGKAENDEPVVTEELNIQANLVFFYYRDLTNVERFYSEVMGLEKVLDYGFAKILRVAPTSHLGLVDEFKGMHSADEPKSVTLALVTDEIDAWYDYLLRMGVEMRGPVGNASRHPTRGFVTLDVGGYFLEFDKFLEVEENTTILDLPKK